MEKVVIRQDPRCLQKLEEARRLISAATERLERSDEEEKAPILFSQIAETAVFPTMAGAGAGDCSSRIREVRIANRSKLHGFVESARPTCTASSGRWARRRDRHRAINLLWNRWC